MDLSLQTIKVTDEAYGALVCLNCNFVTAWLKINQSHYFKSTSARDILFMWIK